jgi:hypothetical protein
VLCGEDIKSKEELMPDRIDINCDMGESFGAYQLGRDQEVMDYISSANIACGWHAGDPMVMEQTVRLAREKGVAVGAHPGYPDLMGFGRRRMDLTLNEIENYMLYQMGALYAFAKAHGLPLQHVQGPRSPWELSLCGPGCFQGHCPGSTPFQQGYHLSGLYWNGHGPGC